MLIINQLKLKYYFLAALIYFTSNINAQQPDSLKNISKKVDSVKLEYQAKSNIIKLNFTSIAVSNLQLQYERIINRKFSVALSYSKLVKETLPFYDFIEKTVDDDEQFDLIKNAALSYYSITPEIRFYLSKKGYGKGFYLAPFYRHTQYSIKGISYEIENEFDETITAALSGNLSSNSFGLLIGSQFNLGKYIVLDWWILGPHAGRGKGSLFGTFSQPFSSEEKNEITNLLNDVEIPFVDSSVDVTDDSVKMDLSGPFPSWGGIRAGLSLGFRF